MQLTCIVCPLGCTLTAEVLDGQVTSVSGNSCKRGETYAAEECVNPLRTLTATVRLKNGGLLPVKAAAPLPKARIMELMAIIKKVRPDPPFAIGDTVIANVGGTGVDMIATSNLAEGDSRKKCS